MFLACRLFRGSYEAKHLDPHDAAVIRVVFLKKEEIPTSDPAGSLDFRINAQHIVANSYSDDKLTSTADFGNKIEERVRRDRSIDVSKDRSGSLLHEKRMTSEARINSALLQVQAKVQAAEKYGSLSWLFIACAFFFLGFLLVGTIRKG